MSELIQRTGLPCDDRSIRQHHGLNLHEAITFFESNTKDLDFNARWIYVEKLEVRLHFMIFCVNTCLAAERPIPIVNRVNKFPNRIPSQQALFIA